MELKVTKITLCGWEQLLNIFNEHTKSEKQWIYRGHSKENDPLETTLERYIYALRLDESKFKKNDDDSKYKCKQKILRRKIGQFNNVLDLEKELMNEFNRRCYLYVKNPPPEERLVELLALMRHYEAPSRLLDWTYSLFVATFFALEKANSNCAVWAIDSDWLEKRIKDTSGNYIGRYLDPEFFDKREEILRKRLFRKNPKMMVHVLNPIRLNDRLVLQQGVFLCPGDISKTFQDNLEIYLNDECQDKIVKYIIKCDRKERIRILVNLHRMNINRATLFPGLEGFSKSLCTLTCAFMKGGTQGRTQGRFCRM